MIRKKTAIDMPNVMLTSVDGTTFIYGMPTAAEAIGIQSTGMRSMRFIRNTQTKIVRPSGAIRLLLPWNVSLTLESTNSTIISTSAWNFVGLPAELFLATRQNRKQNNRPNDTDQNIESTLIVIGLPAHWFHTHAPASSLQTCRFCR